jgi:hypothetical protein
VAKIRGLVYRVKLWWSSYHFQGSPSYILARKLKALKSYLRVWKEVFGNIKNKKQLLLDDLRVLKGLEEERGLVEEEITRKVAMINDLERTMPLEEVI